MVDLTNTKMCKWFLIGCKKPDCRYAHSFSDLRVPMCEMCCNDENCQFYHPDQTLPSKFVLKQKEKFRLGQSMTDEELEEFGFDINQFEWEAVQHFEETRHVEMDARYYKIREQKNPKKIKMFKNVAVYT